MVLLKLSVPSWMEKSYSRSSSWRDITMCHQKIIYYSCYDPRDDTSGEHHYHREVLPSETRCYPCDLASPNVAPNPHCWREGKRWYINRRSLDLCPECRPRDIDDDDDSDDETIFTPPESELDKVETIIEMDSDLELPPAFSPSDSPDELPREHGLFEAIRDIRRRSI